MLQRRSQEICAHHSRKSEENTGRKKCLPSNKSTCPPRPNEALNFSVRTIGYVALTTKVFVENLP